MKKWLILATCVVLVAALATQPASGAYHYEGTVVAIGDSNTHPNNMQPNQMWPGILSGLLGTDIINKGIPAQPTSDMVDRFEDDVLDNNAAMVIIMGGTNDIGREINAKDVNVADIERNLRTMYDTALENNITVIACTILPNDTFMDWQKQKVREVNTWIKAQASERIIIADMNAALRNQTDPDSFNESMVNDDGVHANKAGHVAMAYTVYGVAPTYLGPNDIKRSWFPDGDDIISSLAPGGSLLPIVFGGIGAVLIAVLVADVVRNGKRK